MCTYRFVIDIGSFCKELICHMAKVKTIMKQLSKEEQEQQHEKYRIKSLKISEVCQGAIKKLRTHPMML